MGKPELAILLLGVVHIVVLPLLLWMLLDGERFDRRSWWPGGGPDGGGPEGPRAKGPGNGDAGLPLPDAAQSARRLRTEHERSAGERRHPRRPEHAPEPSRPAPAPTSR